MGCEKSALREQVVNPAACASTGTGPQLPGGLAEQLTVLPPFDPAQLQLHGPEPFTADAVPAVHRLVAGVTLVVAPLVHPHAPLTAKALLLLDVVAVLLPDAPGGAVAAVVVPPLAAGGGVVGAVVAGGMIAAAAPDA